MGQKKPVKTPEQLAQVKREQKKVVEAKRCFRCKQVKIAKYFYRNKGTADGLSTYCKQCSEEYRSDRAQELEVTRPPLDLSATKTCSMCGETKLVILFSRAPDIISGLAAVCKACEAGKSRRAYIQAKHALDSGKCVRKQERKTCVGCGVEKETAQFYTTATSPDGFRARCKTCVSSRVKALWTTRRGKQYSLKARYGVSLEEFDALLKSQDNRCAICQEPPKGERPLHLDHEHATGKVRALLCARCNTLLGQGQDDPELLARAAAYIDKYRE